VQLADDDRATTAFRNGYEMFERQHADDDIQAVGWKRRETRDLNFYAASELFSHEEGPFSLYEVGCGLGAYAEYLQKRHPQVKYAGCDIVEASIRKAKQRDSRLNVELRDIRVSPPAKTDYSVAIGTFHLNHGLSESDWMAFTTSVLRAMYGFSTRGIAATFLSSKVDFQKPFGYYADPVEMLRFAQLELSRTSEIRHGWYPFGFTLLVYRTPRLLAP
jgi:SAM-dependent methyltransferase